MTSNISKPQVVFMINCQSMGQIKPTIKQKHITQTKTHNNNTKKTFNTGFKLFTKNYLQVLAPKSSHFSGHRVYDPYSVF